MEFSEIQKLQEKRAIDLTGLELAIVVAHQIQSKQIELEYVDKETMFKVLCIKSNTASWGLLKWGRHNGYQVRKRGGSNWHLEDLKQLADAYWSSNTTVRPKF